MKGARERQGHFGAVEWAVTTLRGVYPWKWHLTLRIGCVDYRAQLRQAWEAYRDTAEARERERRGR